MEIIVHFFLGFTTSFLGTIFPSMLNMTTLKISIRDNSKKAMFFAAGVSLIVIGQAYVAIAFSKLITDNPDYLLSLQKLGTVIFFVLSIYFFLQVRKSKKTEIQGKEIKTSRFLSGILFSLLNMFAIPFYFGVTSTLVMIGWYQFDMMNNLFFVFGSSIGTFLLLFIYAKLAKQIEKRIVFIAKKMDLILGIITAFVAIINLIDLLLEP